MNPRGSSTRIALCLFIFLISVYLISISASFTSRNSGEGFMKINEMENLLETGQLGVPGTSKWGAPGRNGMRYNWHQFGQQAMILPLYKLMRREAYAYYVLNLLSTALTAVLIMRTLELLGFRTRAAVLPALLYGVGTLAWYYASKTPHEHALAVLFVVGGMFYAVKYQKGLGRLNLLLSMMSIGMGFTVRYDVILTVLPVALYIFMGRRDLKENKFTLAQAAAVSALALAPFFAFNFAINYIKFGNIFETGYVGHSPFIKKRFGLEFVPRGLIGATASPGRSIFLFSPLLALFPFYVRAFKRRVERPFFVASMSAIVLYALFYSFHHSWDGDWCFGPRYFLVIIPFMAMALAPMFEGLNKKRAAVKALVVAILIISVLVQVVFVSANSYLGNVIRYGIDDDSLPELSRQFTRDFGEHGSWKWLMSYFQPEYSQFFNQFKIFRYTALISHESANIYRVADEIRASSAPFLLIYINLMRQYDFWWLQERAPLEGWVVFIPLFIAVASLAVMAGLLRRAD